jgi:hypothetical protein
MKIIPTSVHGILDYIVGIALIAAPYLFGFAEFGGPAVAVPTVLGIGLIVYSLITKYELGLVKILPMKLHLTIDMIAAIVLAISPWLFGFADLPANAWVPHVLVGITVIIVVLLSQSTPRTHDAVVAHDDHVDPVV